MQMAYWSVSTQYNAIRTTRKLQGAWSEVFGYSPIGSTSALKEAEDATASEFERPGDQVLTKGSSRSVLPGCQLLVVSKI